MSDEGKEATTPPPLPQRPPPAIPPGTQLQLLRRLAIGGMAEVHLARALAPGGLQTLVALKRMRPELRSPEYEAMFLDEVRLAERLCHPNLVYVLDTTAARAHRYYVMEYLQGRDGRQLRLESERRGRPIELELALPIVIGAAAGLHHAHETSDDDGRALGIVHRDVSPANLLVTFDGRIKVIDFGIASFADRAAQTAIGVVKGKLRYMSPEQLKLQPLDRRSDIFSLAAVLWELTVGRRAFDDPNDFAVLSAIVERDAPRPSELVADYPPELEAIVHKAMQRDPAQRFASAAAFGAALRAFAVARGIGDATATVARRMATWFDADEESDGARYRFDARPERGFDSAHHTVCADAMPTTIDPVFEISA